MTPRDLFRAGKLQEAIAASNEGLRKQPTDLEARTLLFELLAFDGNLDRAEKQLDSLGSQSNLAEWAVQVYSNMLSAERRRREVFAGNRRPEFLGDIPATIDRQLQAVSAAASGQVAAACQLIQELEDAREPLPGMCDGQEFDDFRDCDDMVGPCFELMMLADYIWVPMVAVLELEITPPERPRDLVWTPVTLRLKDDSEHRGYMPALYCMSYEHEDDAVRLGRATDWQSQPDGPVIGQGHRTFLVGEDARGLLELKTVKFTS